MKLEAKSQVEYYNFVSEMTPYLDLKPTFRSKETGVVPCSSSFNEEASKFFNSNPFFLILLLLLYLRLL